MPLDNLEPLLDAWVERGWLRRLDRALGRFLGELLPGADPRVLLAACLCSHQLGRGHICLDLAATLADPDGALSLPPEGDFGEELPALPSALLAGLSLDAWLAALAASPLVDQGPGEQPLVLGGGRLYLRRYWQYEQQLAGQIRARLAQRLALPSDLGPRLDALFPAGKGPDWQRIACALAVRGNFTVITGGPGTGKTTTVVRLLGLLQQLAMDGGQKLRIQLAAPTGKAAARLTESIGGALAQLAVPQAVRAAIPTQVSTVHRLLGSIPGSRHFRHDAASPLHLDLLVVDEASMVDLELMAQLLDALPGQARLILLGDKDQLASVEAGAVLGDLCEGAEAGGYDAETLAWLAPLAGADLGDFGSAGTALAQHRAMLRQSHRFGEHSGIGQLARAVNAGEPDQVRAVLAAGYGDLARLDLTKPQALARLVVSGHNGGQGHGHYLEVLRQHPKDDKDAWAKAVLAAFASFQLLSALRKGPWGVEGLNALAAEALHGAGLIPATQGWYQGRPVLVSRNDYHLGLMNGDIGICLELEGALRVAFLMPDGSVKWVLPSRLSDVDSVYAMTVHKSQGSEFAHCALVLPESLNPVLTRELVYTGITRARERFTLVAPVPGLLAAAVERRVLRSSGLREALRD
ncbi:exodeoxyribonuclease V subunit alpha [Gallaecimonas kandeliae]|uniref:exodeoxyribonuclease V subunit alpha n=1 Tax=Gallaecimonas kandeliae TaxID=3029055 RepID=UPI002648A0EA|nr:exodeoxyribonuclease V subunit alpha [Gallaecimonas kandeliae]WKE66222.1 exodeoxyribonuclease V subunit alpha [Gallaecimonas kandeliae]